MPLDGAHPPVFRRPLRQTPFHVRTRSASTIDRFLAWRGHATVDVFTSVEQEYFAIRNGCSVYDISPMAKYDIAGSGAEAFLDRLVTRNVRAIATGRVFYALWCDDAGCLIADGTIFRLDDNRFRLIAAEDQLDWLLASAAGFDVTIDDVSDCIAALSVQGPTSCAVLRTLGLDGIDTMRPHRWRRFEQAGHDIMVSRTGFTGDLGYEMWIDPRDALWLWDGLMQAGADRAMRPIGSAALNIARIEAGLVMQEADFVSAETASLTGGMRTPLELALDRFVDFDKGHFTSRRALLEQKRRGPRRRLVGLDIAGHEPAHGALVYADGQCRRQVGEVTSATWSPTCKRNIAFAMVEAGHAVDGATMFVEIDVVRELQRERRILPARITPHRFFAPARARRTPPADV